MTTQVLKTVNNVLTLSGLVVQTLQGGIQGPPGPPVTGGSNKQVMFSDNGNAGFDSGFTYDKTTGVLTLSGKTLTANTPTLQVLTTWNSAGVAFTGALVNVTDTASALASKLLDLQVAGISKWSVDKGGNVTLVGSVTPFADIGSDMGAVAKRVRTVYAQTVQAQQIALTATGSVFGYLTGAADISNCVELQSGTNPTTLRGNGTWTNLSNFERWAIQYVSTGSFPGFTLASEAMGTGTRRNLTLDAPVIGIAGGQLKFPVTPIPSADPNTLDDYEEGAFTPTLTFGGISTGVTYLAQSGKFTKVGNVVQFAMRVQLASKGTAVGNIAIAGLPFTASGDAYSIDCWVDYMTGLVGSVVGRMVAGQSTVIITSNGTGSNMSLTDTNCTANAHIVLTGTYFV